MVWLRGGAITGVARSCVVALGKGALLGVLMGAVAEELLLSLDVDLSDLDLERDLLLGVVLWWFPPPLPVVLAGAACNGGLLSLDLVALAASAALLLVVLWLILLIFYCGYAFQKWELFGHLLSVKLSAEWPLVVPTAVDAVRGEVSTLVG